MNLRAKFEVSSLNRSYNMEVSQNSKRRARDPFTTHLTQFRVTMGHVEFHNST